MTGLHYRKAVRDAVVAALDAGFNDNHKAVAAEYGVDPVSFDFSTGSRNFCQVAIDPGEIELSPLFDIDNQPVMALWTEPAVDDGRVRGMRFSGGVIFHICGIISPRDGAETNNTEDIMDAFEDAALKTLNAYAWPATADASLIFARETRIDRSKLMALDNGYRQWFDLSGKFQVFVP
jgi:hypothetical protein